MLPEAAAGQQQTARAGLTGPAASRTPAWTPSTLGPAVRCAAPPLISQPKTEDRLDLKI